MRASFSSWFCCDSDINMSTAFIHPKFSVLFCLKWATLYEIILVSFIRSIRLLYSHSQNCTLVLSSWMRVTSIWGPVHMPSPQDLSPSPGVLSVCSPLNIFPCLPPILLISKGHFKSWPSWRFPTECDFSFLWIPEVSCAALCVFPCELLCAHFLLPLLECICLKDLVPVTCNDS